MDKREGMTVDTKSNFRGDSRWTGLSSLAGTDLLVGYNENGNLYLFDKATHLYQGYTGDSEFALGPRTKPNRDQRQHKEGSNKVQDENAPPIKKPRKV